MKLLSQPAEDIAAVIIGLTLKEALDYLVKHGVTDFPGYAKVKKIIQDKMNEGKYAFVPDKAEANQLLNFAKNPTFREVQILVPHYRYIDIIRTGLLIDYYHRNDTLENRQRVKSIKIQISNRPNSLKLMKLIDLPGTPFFSTIVEYLHGLKMEGFPSNYLIEKFEELIENWTDTSMLVRKTSNPEMIVDFCNTQIQKKSETFFVLGMKSASLLVEIALKELTDKKILEHNGYVARLTKSIEGNNPRTELMIFLKT
ncbi:MAG: hypothetical protein ABSD42_05930 [Candidatus Bathyarchaeia archaeon]